MGVLYFFYCIIIPQKQLNLEFLRGFQVQYRYCLSGDDVYIFEPWLLEALEEASAKPGEEAVCAGHSLRLPWDHAKETFKWMSLKCMEMFGVGHGGANCVKMAYDLLRPFANMTFVYGAAIFCSNAAMAKLAPFLSTTLVSGYLEGWEMQHSAPLEGTSPVPTSPLGAILLVFCLYKKNPRGYYP